jgi:hypothetical protein
MPERMQAECQCGIRTESHTIALLSARYWRRNGEESPRLPALRWPGSTSVVVFGQGRRSGRTPPPSAVCQDWRLAGLEQLFIGSDQSQPKHPSRGHQKPVGGIAVRQLHASRFLRDLVGDRRAWEPHLSAFAIRDCGFGCNVSLFFWQRVRTSHKEMGESHNSFRGFSSVAVSRAVSRARSSALHTQM